MTTSTTSTLRQIVAGAVVTILTGAPVWAAPFPAVDTSFMGTAFRGVALGQSRAEVEAALATNGFRCLTPEEYPFSPRPDEGFTTCPIARSDFVVDQMGQIMVMVRYDLEQKLGLPYYAVSFVNDVASAITVEPEYFNTTGTSPRYFAEQIIANYGIINGMEPYGLGWRGVSANDEEVIVQTLYNGKAVILVIKAATDTTIPSFD